MARALIGHTGFVGTTLRRNTTFDDGYNSKNIGDIRGKHYDLIVCAGAPAVKWKANQEPEADLANLKMLMGHLEHVTAREFILISTVDVYKTPINVDEHTPIDTEDLHPYGLHRYQLEQFVRDHFNYTKVVRLPGLFGAGLKKNFLYDLIHTGESPWTHSESVYQFYDMSRLWRDLQVVRASDVGLINFATQPLRAGDIALHAFDIPYSHATENPPVSYDMQTIHAGIFGQDDVYMMTANEIYEAIRSFAQEERNA